MTRTATLWVILASVSLSAQTTPGPAAPTSSVSVTGCVAEAQRDGSTGAKATGTQATPENAANEANNPTPTGRYQLLDASPVDAPAGAGDPAMPATTAYGLRGSEAEIEGVRAIQVASVKMIGTNCSAKSAGS